jgi:quercetin dioxygenase-like cupin family protein
MTHFPFQVIDWDIIEKKEHNGETGMALWQAIEKDGLRLRMVEYGPGYLADHWCRKGHFVHCLSGEFTTELQTGEHFVLKEGMSYLVSDEWSAHRSSTSTGVKLLIIDGDFLKL